MRWMFAELFLCRVNRIRERVARKHQADHDGKRARAEAAARMSMGDRREIVAGCKDARKQAVRMPLAAQGMHEIPAHGTYAHHQPAAFAVVHAPRTFAAP